MGASVRPAPRALAARSSSSPQTHQARASQLTAARSAPTPRGATACRGVERERGRWRHLDVRHDTRRPRLHGHSSMSWATLRTARPAAAAVLALARPAGRGRGRRHLHACKQHVQREQGVRRQRWLAPHRQSSHADQRHVQRRLCGHLGRAHPTLTGTATLKNTIVTGGSSPTGANCSGTVASAGHNIEDAGTCNLGGPGDKPGVNPLAPPPRAGGPTRRSPASRQPRHRRRRQRRLPRHRSAGRAAPSRRSV